MYHKEYVKKHMYSISDYVSVYQMYILIPKTIFQMINILR